MTTGLLKGLISVVVAAIAISGCKEGTEDPHSLIFKQKQADAYLNFLAAHPDSSGLRLLTAQKLDSVGRFKEALQQMDTLINEDSSKYGLWVVKGGILLDSTDTTGAQAAYSKALSQFKGEEALLAQGVIYALKGQDTCLKIADQLVSNQAYSHYIKGLFAAQKADTAAALPLLDQSIQLDPGFAQPYCTKARLWMKLGQAANAKAVVLEGLKHNAHSIELLNTAGAVFEAMKEADSARSYYRQSLQIKPYQPVIQHKISAT